MRNDDILRQYKAILFENVEDRAHQLADYCLLLNCLFNIPFKSFIAMDDNRIEDALYMRKECIDSEIGRRYDVSSVEDRYVSVFEVLFALSKRMENDFLCDPMEEIDHSRDHFWLFLRNLGVEKYSNDNFLETNVREKVEKWVRREYRKDGFGSIFPVRRPKKDMRTLQIWDQMSVYILENY